MVEKDPENRIGQEKTPPEFISAALFPANDGRA